MRYTQDSGVRRKSGSEEYKVIVSVYLTPAERDLWGSGNVRLTLERAVSLHERETTTPQPDGTLLADCSCGGTYSVPQGGDEYVALEQARAEHVRLAGS